jgi:hypothetical protein
MLMLDLAQDLPPSTIVQVSGQPSSATEPLRSGRKKKRKREDFEVGASRQGRGTGAGGPVHVSDSYVGVVSHVRRSENSITDPSQLSLLDETTGQPNDEETEPSSALIHLRRGVDEPHTNDSATSDRVRKGDVGTKRSEQEAQQSSTVQMHVSKGPAWFLSDQYRSILGIVAIGGTGQVASATDAASSVEVAIIERPRWDVELPPRFDGGQDWET